MDRVAGRAAAGFSSALGVDDRTAGICPVERGSGLLRALILDDERGPDLVRRALEGQPNGLLLNSPRPNLLRFMPALNVSEGEIDLMIGQLDDLLRK